MQAVHNVKVDWSSYRLGKKPQYIHAPIYRFQYKVYIYVIESILHFRLCRYKISLGFENHTSLHTCTCTSNSFLLHLHEVCKQLCGCQPSQEKLSHYA